MERGSIYYTIVRLSRVYTSNDSYTDRMVMKGYGEISNS